MTEETEAPRHLVVSPRVPRLCWGRGRGQALAPITPTSPALAEIRITSDRGAVNGCGHPPPAV